MKTYSGQLQQDRQIKTLQIKTTDGPNRAGSTTAGSNIVPVMTVSIREMLALLSALSAATGIVLLSVWVAGMEISNILGAATWGLGFVFLGLAVDNREQTARWQLVTGLALLSLAALQYTVSPDFTIASGVLLAIWVAVGMFRQLR